MNEFQHIPATASSLASRKPVFGVGINDANYLTQPRIDGKQVRCPFYQAWKGMLSRAYSTAFHIRRPTYSDCTVTAEWLAFSNFRSWMVEQDWQGRELDKDLLLPGNKVYGPDTCVFVSSQINTLLNDHAADRGLYPQGVCFHKASGKFRAKISIHGKTKYLGYFTTPTAASTAYNEAKSAHIIEVAQTQPDNIKAGLIRHTKLLRISNEI